MQKRKSASCALFGFTKIHFCVTFRLKNTVPSLKDCLSKTVMLCFLSVDTGEDGHSSLLQRQQEPMVGNGKANSNFTSWSSL